MKNFNASEKYYYCPECKKFHEYGSHHSVVNRKLCFFCGKVKSKKTKIIGNTEVGHTQICFDCENINNLSSM